MLGVYSFIRPLNYAKKFDLSFVNRIVPGGMMICSKGDFFFLLSLTYFVCSETLVIFVQGLLCIFKSVKHQLLLPSGLHVGLDGQVARRPSQPPQKLCIVTGGGGEIGSLVSNIQKDTRQGEKM